MAEADELADALTWAEWFCRLLLGHIALCEAAEAHGVPWPARLPDAKFWRGWLSAIEQDQLAARLHGDSEGLLSDYRFWHARNPQLLARVVGAPQRNPYN